MWSPGGGRQHEQNGHLCDGSNYISNYMLHLVIVIYVVPLQRRECYLACAVSASFDFARSATGTRTVHGGRCERPCLATASCVRLRRIRDVTTRAYILTPRRTAATPVTASARSKVDGPAVVAAVTTACEHQPEQYGAQWHCQCHHIVRKRSAAAVVQFGGEPLESVRRARLGLHVRRTCHAIAAAGEST